MVLRITEQGRVATVGGLVICDHSEAQHPPGIAAHTVGVQGKASLAVLAPMPVVQGLPLLALWGALIQRTPLGCCSPATGGLMYGGACRHFAVATLEQYPLPWVGSARGR